MGKQKKFSKKIGEYDGVDGITEYDSEGLPVPQKGRKSLDPGFESIYEYQSLDALVAKARSKFYTKIHKKIHSEDINKIDLGLRDFALSSVKHSNNLSILKASILNAFDNDMITTLYDSSNEEVKQMINRSYFENLDDLQAPDLSNLIKPESIKIYMKLAQRYTKKVLKKYLEKSTQNIDKLSDFEVHRGQGNFRYYKNDRAKNFPDTISVYTGIGNNPFEYFERQLFNSYSINERVAEHFMVLQENQRRILLSAEFLAILPFLFTSFAVTDVFDKGQYELLTLCNTEKLFIREKVNNERSAEFLISSKSQ